MSTEEVFTAFGTARPEDGLPELKRVVFVVDGEVGEVMTCDARLAAVFLSNPTIVDATDVEGEIWMGYQYDAATNSFTPGVA